ncbi:MAG: T9SS type A sorting domain-containing protein [Ignavibacteriales bacterium]|nr:T9SS type A sorting domain-containing protein [Ignavibacteriales bacterium]
MCSIKILSLILLIPVFCYPQGFLEDAEFETGKIGVQVNEFGRIRIHGPKIDNKTQIDRASWLISVNRNNVFDYMNDALPLKSFQLADPPLKSGYEIVGSIYSSNPPIVVEMSVYGWWAEAYSIIKMSVINNADNNIATYIGLEIIPKTESEYGNESVRVNNGNKLIEIFKKEYVAFKFFKERGGFTMHFNDWYYNYFEGDTTLYDWLTNTKHDTLYKATVTGSILTFGIPGGTIKAYESTTVYLAVAYGRSRTEVEENIAKAELSYQTITEVKNGEEFADSFSLMQNFPNPFNSSTRITFTLIDRTYIKLKVFNSIGQEIETLVNATLDKGFHTVEFNAENLPSGVYFYSIQTEENTALKKMILLR